MPQTFRLYAVAGDGIPIWRKPRACDSALGNGFLDVTQLVLAEEDLLADEEGR